MKIFNLVEKLLNLKKNKEIKSIMVESKQVSYMKEINQQSRDQDNINLKYQVLDGFEEAFGDKYFRLKDETRQALDEVAFLGKDAGFVYARPTHFEDTCNITERTFRKNMTELEQLGQVIKLHQHTRKCNGRGTPIYLLVNHPMFEYWIDYLGLEQEIEQVFSNFQTEIQTENGENPCDSKRQRTKNIATYVLPFFKHEITNSIAIKDFRITNNMIPIEIKEDKDFQNVVNMYALKMWDKVKTGFNIKYLSSLVSKDVRHQIRLAFADENMREIKARKQKEEESRKLAIELKIKEKKPLPFYNWLEGDSTWSGNY